LAKQREPESQPGADPRQRLLAATIACIEEDGISALTSRGIAAKAGLNGAAVNYYFGSKDDLVARALELTRHEGFVQPLADFDALVQQGATPAEAMRSVVRQLLGDSLNFPKVAFAHLREAIENQRYDDTSIRQLNQFLDKLDRRLGPPGPAARRTARRARLAQIWSVIGLTAMAPRLFQNFNGLDLRRPRDLDLYVDQLLLGLIEAS
jgi:AcrR family transcriptional regulator